MIRLQNQVELTISIIVFLLMTVAVHSQNYYPLFICILFFSPYAVICFRNMRDMFNKWRLIRKVRHQICHQILYEDLSCVEKQISEDCLICLEIFHSSDKIVLLPCGCFQPYHPECIVMWLEQKASCPLCRTDLLNPASEEKC